MKKMFLMLALATALFAAKPANAQFHDDSPTNRTYSAAGLNNIAHQDLKTRVVIQWHYTAKDPELIRHKITDAFVAAMNAEEETKGTTLRFTPVNGDTTEGQGLNFTLYFDFYSNGDGTYSIFLCVHGWGQGHLFRISETKFTEDNFGTSFASLAVGAADRLAFGWTAHEDSK